MSVLRKHWKQFLVVVVTLVIYCVLISVRGDIANPSLRTAAGVVAGVSIGVSMVLALRLGRKIGGRTGR